MIKKVSIQVNHRLICSGMAVIDRGEQKDFIFFDVVKGDDVFAPRVIVGGRGKQLSEDESDEFEDALLNLFVEHQVLMEVGTYIVSA